MYGIHESAQKGFTSRNIATAAEAQGGFAVRQIQLVGNQTLGYNLHFGIFSVSAETFA